MRCQMGYSGPLASAGFGAWRQWRVQNYYPIGGMTEPKKELLTSADRQRRGLGVDGQGGLPYSRQPEVTREADDLSKYLGGAT